jgi:AcrR family transcriptional regulator
MKQDLEASSEPGVLTPSVPWDIGARAQRERILKAMARSVAEKTFSATTIADIVGHASISRATFYKHFANKRECFDATATAFLTELQKTAKVARSTSDGSASSTIRNVVAAVLDLLAVKPHQTQVLLVEAPIVDPDIVRRYRLLILEALAAQQQGGRPNGVTGADPEIAFGRAKVLIVGYLAAGRVKELPSLLPELVYIAHLPYLGQDLALRQARLAR